MTKQEETISKIEQAMRRWIEKQIPVYAKLPAAQTMTTTQGEEVLKANPATQEIRAAFKDYCYIVKVQKEISGEEEKPQTSTIDELRKKFKVIS